MLDPDKLKYRMGLKFLDGLTLARECGVSKTTIYNILNARVQPKPATMQKLCEVLECEPYDLLKEA